MANYADVPAAPPTEIGRVTADFDIGSSLPLWLDNRGSARRNQNRIEILC